MLRRLVLILLFCPPVLTACSSSGSSRAIPQGGSAPAAINCPNTFRLTAEPQMNSGISHADLEANVIPPNPLWVAMCVYGYAPSGHSDTGEIETLAQGGGQTASKERSLINAINSGQAIGDPSVYDCPMDNGQTYLLLFTYRSIQTVRVAASLFGCQFITNGVRTVRSVEASATLLAMAGSHTHGGPPLDTPTTGP